MEQHVGKAPDPYEPEWCVEQAVLYRDCRSDYMEELAKQQRQQQQPPATPQQPNRE